MWRQKMTEVLADLLRFSVRGALMINGILLALATVYFVAKFLFFTLRYADRTVFSAPW